MGEMDINKEIIKKVTMKEKKKDPVENHRK